MSEPRVSESDADFLARMRPYIEWGPNYANEKGEWCSPKGPPNASDVQRALLLAGEIATLRAKLEEAERARDEARYGPIGDNHHNAMKCPYCNPRQIDAIAEKARVDRAEAALAQARVVTAEMVEAALEVLVDFEWTGFMEVDVRAALEAALNARKEG